MILHEDHSDPLVHVDVTYHVGANREEVGRSGFAHFFEHMMFQGSENVGKGEHFGHVNANGGRVNGFTDKDNPGNGTAQVDLRGLGSNRTLVMLNGRRLASAGIGSSVDINSLPQSLIERVEVITGGATTVYGSDAVAGVVNFITRNDFEGFGLDASAYTTEQGDSTTYDVSFTYGHQFSKGNVTVFGGYYDREPLFQGDREFTQVAWVDFGGELFPGGSSATPSGTLFSPRIDFGDGQGPVRTYFEDNGDPRAFVIPDDLYNYAPVNYLQLPLQRYMGGVLASFDEQLSGKRAREAALRGAEAGAERRLPDQPVAAFSGCVPSPAGRR
ncbi:MAG: TonB-dependent receptor plug domain-containing protein [Pseudomonadota bacterium]